MSPVWYMTIIVEQKPVYMKRKENIRSLIIRWFPEPCGGSRTFV